MTGASLLGELGVLVVTGTLAAVALRPLGVPSVVAFIGAGLLLGPGTDLLHVTPGVHLLSELGVALLLFLVGLEMSLDRIRAVGPVAVVVGLAQVAIVGLLAAAAGLAAGLEPTTAGVAGLAVSFSSTAVVVKLLDRAGELASHHGQLALGILLVQDLVVVVALTVLAGLGGPEAGAGGLTRSLLTAAGGMAALVVGAAAAARFVLPGLFARVSGERETLFVWSLAWCFALVLSAEGFHLSVELGAFLAGVSLAQLPGAHDLSRRVAPLSSFLLAVFFVALGVELDPEAALAAPAAVALLIVVAGPGKGVLLAWILARRGEDEETAVRTGLVLAQTSEFSFILAGAAAAAGVVEGSLAGIVGVVGLLTIGASSYGIVHNRRIYLRIRGTAPVSLLGARAPDPDSGHRRPAPRDHVIVVGMNTLGRALVRRLAEAGERVLAVDTDPRKLTGLAAETLAGSAHDPAVLAEAGLDGARLLVSALRIEDVNEVLAHQCRRAGVPSAIHAFDPSTAERLRASGADHLIVSRDEGTRRIADELRKAGVLL